MALKSLEIGDTITSQITVTNGYHDGGVGTLAGSNCCCRKTTNER